jgi:hypothetical protein
MKAAIFAVALLLSGPAMGQGTYYYLTHDGHICSGGSCVPIREYCGSSVSLGSGLVSMEPISSSKDIDVAYALCEQNRMDVMFMCKLQNGDSEICKYKPKWQEACAKIEKMKETRDLEFVNRIAGYSK